MSQELVRAVVKFERLQAKTGSVDVNIFVDAEFPDTGKMRQTLLRDHLRKVLVSRRRQPAEVP